MPSRHLDARATRPRMLASRRGLSCGRSKSQIATSLLSVRTVQAGVTRLDNGGLALSDDTRRASRTPARARSGAPGRRGPAADSHLDELPRRRLARTYRVLREDDYPDFESEPAGNRAAVRIQDRLEVVSPGEPYEWLSSSHDGLVG